MKYDERLTLSIIDSAVVDCMNSETHLFGKNKRFVTRDDLFTRTRKKEVVICRQMCQYLADFIFNDILVQHFTLEYIGNIYGRDHATVIHSKKCMNNYKEIDKQILYMIAHCMDVITRRMKGGESSKKAHRWYGYLYPQSSIF